MSYTTQTRPYTAICPPSTLKIEVIEDIDPQQLAQYNHLTALQFQEVQVLNCLEHLIPVNFKWFASGESDDWLNNDRNFIFFLLVYYFLFII